MQRAALLALVIGSGACAPSRPVPLVLPPLPRVLVVAPHPDDETIAAGGLITRLTARGAPVTVVFVTDGDGWQWAVQANVGRPDVGPEDYRALGVRREGEARQAARALGLADGALRFLRFPDGGLDELWTAHWRRTAPYTSVFTERDRPPGAAPGVRYDGEDLIATLIAVVEDVRPDVVVLPHPSDSHADHATVGLFVARAVDAATARGLLPARPQCLAYLVHHPHWPPSPNGADDPMPPPAPALVPHTSWRDFALAPAERAAKSRALAAYATQLAASPDFLHRFLRPNEVFAALAP
ncbi:MAG: PIG-L family deacetylase [Candidatus Binatia bacterium]